MPEVEKDPRFPWTYADDFIRRIAGSNATGAKLSRSDASQILQTIAEILGIDHYDLATKLANHFKEKINNES